jgi:hypothetical protein
MESAPDIDWQSWAAIGVVALTVFVLVARGIFGARKSANGCGRCGSRDCD